MIKPAAYGRYPAPKNEYKTQQYPSVYKGQTASTNVGKDAFTTMAAYK